MTRSFSHTCLATAILAGAMVLGGTGAAFAEDPTAPAPSTMTAAAPSAGTATGPAATGASTPSATDTTTPDPTTPDPTTSATVPAAATASASTGTTTSTPVGDAANSRQPPSIEIYENHGLLMAPVKTGQVLRAGTTPEIGLRLVLPVGGTYSNVHFSTSHPGSASGCSISDLMAQVGEAGAEAYTEGCTVNLAPLAAGENRTYSATMTGERDGKPFTVSHSIQLYGADVTVRVLLDGQDITGGTGWVTRHKQSTLTFILTNRSPKTLTVSHFRHLAVSGDKVLSTCHNLTVAPGGTGRCSSELGSVEPTEKAGSAPIDWLVGDASGGAWTVILKHGTKLAWLDGGENPATGTGTTGTGTSTPDVTIGSGSQATDGTTPPLAETGIPVGVTLASVLGLLGVGGGSVVIARRRR